MARLSVVPTEDYPARWVTLLPWLLPSAGLLILAGYFGPWVPHRVAGLVVTGLDLGEYVKFLPVVRSGEVTLWREGFYLPLVTVSIACSSAAFAPQLCYRWLVRIFLLGIATVAALNLLPPAWSPAVLQAAEFRQQVLALIACLVAIGVSPFLALLPRWFVALGVVLLSGLALWWPPQQFLAVLPAIRELYQQPLTPGWGFYVMISGLLLLIVAQGVGLYGARRRRPE